jgi:hypothetical protein
MFENASEPRFNWNATLLHMANSTPVRPGQRRHAFAFRQGLIVKVVSLSVSERGKWICLAEPGSDPVFIAESEFGDVLPLLPGDDCLAAKIG